MEDQNDLRQTVHQIKSIEMEQYQSMILPTSRNACEFARNGWGTILVIDDEDKYEDDEEKERIDLLIGNLENRRPRTDYRRRNGKVFLAYLFSGSHLSAEEEQEGDVGKRETTFG